MKKNIIATLFLCSCFTSVSIANEETTKVRSIQLTSGPEFQLSNTDQATFTIQPLKKSLRTIENLKHTEAVGITYLGNLTLSEDTTPLSALREVSVQISNGLDIDLALITDSTTSESLKPHEMLLLYHPKLVITLALTKVEASNEYTLIGTYAKPVDQSKLIANSTQNNAAQ